MRPSEVRRRVLSDHEALGDRLDEIEDLAGAVQKGNEESASALRMRGAALLEALGRHMRWEERHLVPVLRESDAWGPERVRRLDAEHREQREVLRHVLETLADRTRPAHLVARRLRDFALLLRAEMTDEESAFLDPAVVRDDIVGVDVEAG